MACRFARNMFLRLTPEEIKTRASEFTILHTDFEAPKNTPGLNSGVFVIIPLLMELF